jgi:hypothetical protein
LAILTVLTLRAVFRRARRQAEAPIGSIIRLPGLTLRVPDHTTLSRHSAILVVPPPQPTAAAVDVRPLHLLVNVRGWSYVARARLVEKRGTRRRRAWRKLHLGVDADTGQVVASALTSKEVDDGVLAGPLLDLVTGSLSAFTADGKQAILGW